MKGDKNKIENYRPISNLCCASKIFEKLILMRIKKIQVENDIDLTGKPQHGFKEKRSTLTAGLTIQSIISFLCSQLKNTSRMAVYEFLLVQTEM